MSEWIKELFGNCKPVIAMAHLPALPSTPRYNEALGIAGIIDRVRTDVDLLVKGGVDAVMFCNEDDRPYVFKATIDQIAVMTRVVTECRPKYLPFGVDFLWDPMAAMAIAHATGANFIREVLTGVYEFDMGLWSPDAGEVMRFRKQVGAEHVKVFYNIVPEFAASLGDRSIAQRARSAVVSCLADVILVSGPMAGSEPVVDHFYAIKEAVNEIPVFLNTGARVENISTFLKVADGVIVGSSLKEDGDTWNPVDPKRVKEFLVEVNKARVGEIQKVNI